MNSSRRRLAQLAVLFAVFCGCDRQCADPNAAPMPGGEALPAQFKGYELYAWTDAAETWFTLISGTNRSKTPDDVFSAEREIVDEGWVVVTVRGTTAAGALLARIPRDEFVYAVAVRFPSGPELETIPTPAAVADFLRTTGESLGLNLTVAP